MKLNIELFKRLRNRFARMRHPQHFRMAQVAIKTDCGAAMCFVGHTLTLEGYKMRLRKDGPEVEGTAAARSDYDFIDLNDKAIYDPTERAQELLGLNPYQGRQVFQAYHLKTPKQAVKFLDRIITTGKVEEN